MRLLFALLLCGCGGEPSPLGDGDFESFAATHRAFLLLVYAPWCGHSRELLPHFAKAEKALPSVPFAKLDGTTNERVATLLDVKGYPSLFFIREGASPIQYAGAREASAIAEWGRAKLHPQLSRLGSGSALEAFVRSHDPAFVLWGEEEDAITGVAAATELACGVAEASLPPPPGVEAPALVAFRGHATSPAAVLSPPLSIGRAERWARVESLPLVLRYSSESEEKLFNAEVGLHLLVFQGKAALPSSQLEEAAKQLRGEVVVATISASKHPEAADFFDASGKGGLTLPVAVLYSLVNGTKFATYDLSAEGLVSFVHSALRGEVEEHLRSAAPQETSGEVVELTGHSYSKTVFDDTKDVLVQFYSSSCGHCRKLAPVYQQLASKLAEDEDLIVAQIDGTTNDAPGFIPEGFPTIIFFPKMNKKGVEYDGSRDLHDMEQFISDVRAGREHIGGLPDSSDAESEAHGAKLEL